VAVVDADHPRALTPCPFAWTIGRADAWRARSGRGPVAWHSASYTAHRQGAVILSTDRERIIQLAAKHRLPAIYDWRERVEAGGLIAYGGSVSGFTRRAAVYVDRIFKGANPADLPVERATTFELAINLRTAKALGLTIPPSLLLRADQVIE
jgi:hypothetical protein